MQWKGFRNQIQTLVTLLQCSEQQPFSYSVILWKWMNSQVEGKTKNELCATDTCDKGTRHGSCCFIWVFSSGRCGNGALVNNDDAWHETKSSQFEREVVSLLQVIITVVWSVSSWNFFSMTNHSLCVFSPSLDTREKKELSHHVLIFKKIVHNKELLFFLVRHVYICWYFWSFQDLNRRQAAECFCSAIVQHWLIKSLTAKVPDNWWHTCAAIMRQIWMD